MPQNFDTPRFLKDFAQSARTTCGWCDRPLGGKHDGNAWCSVHCRDAWLRGSEGQD